MTNRQAEVLRALDGGAHMNVYHYSWGYIPSINMEVKRNTLDSLRRGGWVTGIHTYTCDEYTITDAGRAALAEHEAKMEAKR